MTPLPSGRGTACSATLKHGQRAIPSSTLRSGFSTVKTRPRVRQPLGACGRPNGAWAERLTSNSLGHSMGAPLLPRNKGLSTPSHHRGAPPNVAFVRCHRVWSAGRRASRWCELARSPGLASHRAARPPGAGPPSPSTAAPSTTCRCCTSSYAVAALRAPGPVTGTTRSHGRLVPTHRGPTCSPRGPPSGCWWLPLGPRPSSPRRWGRSRFFPSPTSPTSSTRSNRGAGRLAPRKTRSAGRFNRPVGNVYSSGDGSRRSSVVGVFFVRLRMFLSVASPRTSGRTEGFP